MNIVFAGTPAFAVPCLQALLEHGDNVVAVYTQPDRPAGRATTALAACWRVALGPCRAAAPARWR